MSRILSIICISLLLASTSYAVVIGTWENGSADGWNTWNADGGSNGSVLIGALPFNNGGTTTYSSSTIGVTNGGSSLAVAPPSGFLQCLGIQSYKDTVDSHFVADFLSNTKFSIDVTYNSGSWASGNWAQVYTLDMQGTGLSFTDVGGRVAQPARMA